MSEKGKVPEAKTWANWLLIIIGIILFTGGVLYLPSSLRERLIPAEVTEVVQKANLSGELAAALGLAGGFHLLVYGVFSIIAGIGLFARRAWAWGMAIMLLSIIVVMTVVNIATAMINNTFDPILMLLPTVAAVASLVAWLALVSARKAYTA